MKRAVVLMAVLVFLVSMLSACGRSLMVDGKDYPTYGLFNENSKKSEKRVAISNFLKMP